MIEKSLRNVAVLGLCLFAIPLSGCNADGRSLSPRGTPIPQQQRMQGDHIQGVTPQQQGLQRDNLRGTTPNPGQGALLGTNPMNPQAQPQQMSENRQKADNIRNELKNMREIENVSVIVNGNTALVAYKPADNVGDVNATKSMISSRVKDVDKTITEVRVSESPDIMTRIDRLSRNITDNRPMNAITNEFNELFQGINPIAQ